MIYDIFEHLQDTEWAQNWFIITSLRDITNLLSSGYLSCFCPIEAWQVDKERFIT